MAKKYLNLGQTLKKLLFARDLKPADLSREVHIPPPTIHRLITGKSKRPYKSSLKPIAEFFSISVEQLIGEESLPETIWDKNTNILQDNKLIKSIPIISWNQLDDWLSAIKTSEKRAVTLGNLGANCFALVLNDSSMEPFFARGTLLIFNPEEQPKDRSYVLVRLEENNRHVFRQLIIDGNDYYLKPLNPDLSLFKMRFLDKKDIILACLIESRNKYLPEDQLKMLEDT